MNATKRPETFSGGERASGERRIVVPETQYPNATAVRVFRRRPSLVRLWRIMFTFGMIGALQAAAQSQRPTPTPPRQSIPPPFAFPSGGITGSTDAFIRLSLPRNVAIAVPRAWRVLGPNELQLIDTAAGAMADLSGADIQTGADQVLIAANSMPTSTYAAVRVTSSMPPTASTAEIRELSRLVGYSSATHPDLAELGTIMRTQMDSMLSAGGMRVTHFYGVRIDRLGGHTTLVTEYKRTGQKGDVFVQINQILTGSQDIQINLSYRESERLFWVPVLGRIRHSIAVK